MDGLTNTLLQRLSENGRDNNKTVKAVVLSTTGIRTEMLAKRDAVRNDKNLSPLGQQQALRKVAEPHVATIGRARRQVEQGRAARAERLAALKPKSNLDKTNFVEASLHILLGQKLGAMQSLPRLALLSDKDADPRLIAAAIELPSAITGLSPKEKVDIENTFVKLNHSAALAKLDEENEAWELADQAVIAATRAIYEAGEFTSESEFNKFATTHDPVDAKAEAEESERLAAETVMAAAVALPLSTRITLGGELLDRNTADFIEAERAA